MPRLSKEVIAFMEKEKEIARLQGELTRLQLETEHFKQYGTFRDEVKLEVNKAKMTGLVIAVVVILVAVYAYFSWQKALNDATAQIEKTNREISARVFGLERGYFLYQHNYFQDAIPYLKASYEQDPRDERVLIEYLDSLDQALTVVQPLRSDPVKFSQFKSGDFYDRVGCLLLEKGLTDPASLEDSFTLFNLSVNAYPAGDGRRMYPNFNLFRYWLLKGNKTQAESALEESGWAQKNQLSDLASQKWFEALSPKTQRLFAQIKKDFKGAGRGSDLLSAPGKTLKPAGKKG
jgi:hypothetical protein